jgi:DGQHR domain-containing protein
MPPTAKKKPAKKLAAKKQKLPNSSKSNNAAAVGFITVPAIPVKQGDTTLYLLTMKAKDLWGLVKINNKAEDKDEGYQRVLSGSRVRAIAQFIKAKNPIPLSVLVTFNDATVEHGGKTLKIPAHSDAGWVIDGQHRLAGAHESDTDFELPVVAFVGLGIEEQVRQFVTINREAKGVPTSLYYDLLKYLPTPMSPADAAKERAADIGNDLKRDDESPFFGKIVITTSPKKGELSLNNFVRKVGPLVIEGKGLLSAFSIPEQRQVLANYYKALENIFPKSFQKSNSIFFQTLGFGALMNALPTFFNLCIAHHQGFRVADAAAVFKEVEHFDFDAWQKYGTGSSAEIQAGEDLRGELIAAFDTKAGATSIQL